MADLSSQGFFTFKLKDVIELIIVVAGAILFVTGGFARSDTKVEQNTENIGELTRAVATLTQTVHDVDLNGTRHSSQVDAVQQKQIEENTRRIEKQEQSYAQIYDILSSIKAQVGTKK